MIRVVGWGPFRLPGERRQHRKAEEEARRMTEAALRAEARSRQVEAEVQRTVIAANEAARAETVHQGEQPPGQPADEPLMEVPVGPGRLVDEHGTALPRWRGLTDPVAIRRQTLHDAWLAIHIRRFDGHEAPPGGLTYDGRPKPGGPDSIYHGIRIAENELRDLWAETGDPREIGSLSNWEAPGDAMPSEVRDRRSAAAAERQRAEAARNRAMFDDEVRAAHYLDEAD